MIQMNFFTKQKSHRNIENKFMVTKGEIRGMYKLDIGINSYILLCIIIGK